MSILKGRHILLGVTAGIAAYKTASLVRLFIKAGAEVKVIMTPKAKEFVTPLTLSTLSKHPVLTSFTAEDKDGALWNNHVELGLWADLFVIAPATANTLAKMATGRSDNLLVATYLSAKCSVYFAPAMDLDMHKHPSTKASFETLESFGNIRIPATSGELASGLVGEGRMAEPQDIVTAIENHITTNSPLYGKHLLITAGPTYEAIDPVRFIGNHSSGAMGFELAKTAAQLGAKVTLIAGPTHYTVDNAQIQLIPVINAQDMYDAALVHFSDVDIAILAAAVADYTPKQVANRKLKKSEASMILELKKTKDILAKLGALKTKQFLVGFALETNNEIENATKKLKSKNLDLIVLNSLMDKGAGFGGMTNKVTLIDRDLQITPFPLKPKSEVALDILNSITIQIHA
jgi:phosphopantothenoylcysteine decarboxylase/phosphopantothenate--cysteine ligase